MAKRIYRDFPLAKKVTMIANTGQEAEESLVFGDRCDKEFGLNAVWIEAVVHPEEGVCSTHKVVTFETASRKGEPYRAVIKKYGLPNVEYLHCTRELKTNPMYSYIHDGLGWKPGEYVVALGIRADEPKRISIGSTALGIWYPLAETGVTKPEINDIWRDRDFTLKIEEFEGNCSWCFKKSDLKLIAAINKDPSKFVFPDEMERLYADLKVDETHKPRHLFRKNRTTKEMIMLAEGNAMNPVRMYLPREDEPGGCSESCEPL